MLDHEDKLLKTLLATAPPGSRREARLRILLSVIGGKSNEEIARDCGACEKTVRKVRRRHSIFGVEGAMDDAPRSGRDRTISGEKEEEMLSLLNQSQSPENGVLTGGWLSNKTGIPRSTTYRYLTENGIGTGNPDSIREAIEDERDPRNIVGLMLSPEVSVIAFSCDNGRSRNGVRRHTFNNHRGNTAAFCRRTIGSVLNLVEKHRTFISSMRRVASDPAEASIFIDLVERRLNGCRGTLVATGVDGSGGLSNLERHCARDPRLLFRIELEDWMGTVAEELRRIDMSDRSFALMLENLKVRLDRWLNGPERMVGTFSWMVPRDFREL